MAPIVAMAQLDVGAEAPRVDVKIESGETLSLAGEYEKGPVLVYFYPKSDTPGCTAQACNIRDHFVELNDKGVRVLGVSRDDQAAQMKFKQKYSLPFHLVADPEGEVGKAFGVDAKGSGAYARQSFLIINGQIVWRDLKAAPDTQAADALKALEEAGKKG
jgi:peroxiredoxin Q/BCP